MRSLYVGSSARPGEMNADRSVAEHPPSLYQELRGFGFFARRRSFAKPRIVSLKASACYNGVVLLTRFLAFPQSGMRRMSIQHHTLCYRLAEKATRCNSRCLRPTAKQRILRRHCYRLHRHSDRSPSKAMVTVAACLLAFLCRIDESEGNCFDFATIAVYLRPWRLVNGLHETVQIGAVDAGTVTVTTRVFGLSDDITITGFLLWI